LDQQTLPVGLTGAWPRRRPHRANENPAGIRGCRRGLSCFTSRKVAALELKRRSSVYVPAVSKFSCRDPLPVPFIFGRVLQPSQRVGVISSEQCKEVHMKKALAILATVATVGATTLTAPAQARGIGPGLAFGLAAGAIAAGVAGAYGPYYGPGYGYYGPRYYGPAYYGPAYYGPGPYAYYGGPYYRHRYYRHW
jgi:hypothetical protein